MAYKNIMLNDTKWNYKVRSYIAELSYLMHLMGNVKQVISKPCLTIQTKEVFLLKMHWLSLPTILKI